MQTRLTPYQIADALDLLDFENKSKSLLTTRERKVNFAACSFIAMQHMKAEFELLEEYHQELITYSRFKIKLAKLITNRYQG